MRSAEFAALQAADDSQFRSLISTGTQVAALERALTFPLLVELAQRDMHDSIAYLIDSRAESHAARVAAIEAAAHLGHYLSVEVLLENDAFQWSGSELLRPFALAASVGHEPTARLISSSSAFNPDLPGVLHAAVAGASPRMVRELLEIGVSVDARINKSNDTVVDTLATQFELRRRTGAAKESSRLTTVAQVLVDFGVEVCSNSNAKAYLDELCGE
ncbi:MAG: hypothetical protein AAGA68_24935 [Pseudomonadota bacterium]